MQKSILILTIVNSILIIPILIINIVLVVQLQPLVKEVKDLQPLLHLLNKASGIIDTSGNMVSSLFNLEMGDMFNAVENTSGKLYELNVPYLPYTGFSLVNYIAKQGKTIEAVIIDDEDSILSEGIYWMFQQLNITEVNIKNKCLELSDNVNNIDWSGSYQSKYCYSTNDCKEFEDYNWNVNGEVSYVVNEIKNVCNKFN